MALVNAFGALNLEATQASALSNLVSILAKLNASIAVTGPLTDTQLRATPVPVSGTVTANVGTGVQPVNDNGGSLTVDGTVAVSSLGGTVAVTQSTSPWVVSGTVTADTELPAAAALADADPNPTTSRVGANNLLFNGTTWDRARAGTATGSTLVNNPTAANLNMTVGNAAGASAVNIQDGGNSITVDGTVAVSSVGGTVAVTGPLTDTQLRATPVPVSGPLTDTQLRASPVPVSGTVTITDGSGPVTVDGTVAVSSVGGTVAVTGPLTDTQLRATPVPVSGTVTISDGSGPVTVDGTVATNSERAEDSSHSSGQVGNFVLAVRNDAGTSLVDATLDYAPLQVNSVGELRVTTSGGSPTGRDDTDDQAVVATGAGLSVVRNYVFDGTNWDRTRSGGVTGMQGIAGAEAHDAPVTGNPLLMGGRASNAAPADVSADGDVARRWTTRAGVARVYNSRRRRTGLYYASLGNSTVLAAADAATAGRWWLQVPVGATVFAAVRKVTFSMSTTTGLLAITAPVFTVERFTFTGTASGAAITPAKRDSSDATATGIIRTANTGMTITAGAAAHGFQVPSALATTSASTAQQTWPNVNDEDEFLILRAGEGIVIRQSTAGTVADTRIVNFDLQWEEFNSTDFVVRD